ncbi:ribonuclease H-like domain-containing protein [Tanacetum coccineum]
MESWSRSIYARAKIYLHAHIELRESMIVAIPRLDRNGSILVTIRVEYEWKPPRYALCKTFGHCNEQCHKKIISVQTVTLDEVAKPCTSSVEMVDKVDDIVENRVTRKRKSCLCLAGSLQYLTFTRPNISYAVQQVCLYMHDHREPHFSAQRILNSASTKHIEIVRDLVAARQVRVLHVPSRYQYADIFTKGLPSALFEEFRSSLSVWCPLAQTAGEC